MFSYRITKYDPRYRDERGFYMRDEWTCYSDVGKVFEGKKLTYQDYRAVEDSYIQAIILFMDCLQIDSLTVESLERYPKSSEHLEKVGCSIQWFNNLENNLQILKESIPEVVRLILRRQLWCQLVNPMMYVHFGHEYYMFIGSTQLCSSAIAAVKNMGLFVEDFESPWNRMDE